MAKFKISDELITKETGFETYIIIKNIIDEWYIVSFLGEKGIDVKVLIEIVEDSYSLNLNKLLNKL